MPGLLIRDISPTLYRRLKASATQHHRSLNREALAILEGVLQNIPPSEPKPRPLKGRFPITQKILDKAKAEGRA